MQSTHPWMASLSALVMTRFSRTLIALGAALLVATAGGLTGAAASKHADSSSSPSAGRIQTGANSTLVCVQVVSRHGTRAPNPVVSKLCPADRANLALYAHLRITLAGLTGTGMAELYDMGVFTRQQYIERTYPGFLSNFFNDQEVYFRGQTEEDAPLLMQRRLFAVLLFLTRMPGFLCFVVFLSFLSLRSFFLSCVCV